jgi:hypothetical protein
MRKSDFKLNVPMALKRLLVEDYEYVTKSKQVIEQREREREKGLIIKVQCSYCHFQKTSQSMIY